MAGEPKSVIEMENLDVTPGSGSQSGSRIVSDDGRAERTRQESVRRREPRDSLSGSLNRPNLIRTSREPSVARTPPLDTDSKPHISLCQVRIRIYN